jgi:hypothetical protein
MKQHEREFFISMIRSGNVKIKYNDLVLIIKPPTFDLVQDACDVYNETYQQAYIDGMMDEDENYDWMINNEMWSYDDEQKIKGLEKDLERLKIEIYNARNNVKLKNSIRMYIRSGETQLKNINNKKHAYFSNTCEGIATSEKTSHIIKNSTYYENKLYDFDQVSLSYVIDEYHNSFLQEYQCRELARNEPWKSLWVIKHHLHVPLFNNPAGTDLTYNQKNLVIWSQMYDNIQESLECPPKDVIDDDDMLDGWFILQNKKREREQAEQEFEQNTKNSKIKNASEVFVMGSDASDIERIDNMNTLNSNMIKQQRMHILKKHGQLEQQYFPDEQLKLRSQSTNQFRSKFKGG